MTYHLGIDVGTTYTSAAVVEDSRAEPVRLGTRGLSVPSVVARTGGDVVVGELAEQRAAGDPGAAAREFKRRVGDPSPVLLAGSPVAAELLMARVARWALGEVAGQRGAPPAAVVATHPANWGEFKLDLYRQALRHTGVEVDDLVPEPVAAATFYAAHRPLDEGTLLAVYDLGGGTFDAAVVRAGGADGAGRCGFSLVGRPGGIERLGGIDFDHAVLGHVLAAVGLTPDALDTHDPSTTLAAGRLRRACVEAKEALSTQDGVTVPVLLPRRQAQVPVTRADFEQMVRPALAETVRTLRGTVADAGVAVDDLAGVLLVGGSSRIPLVADLVREGLGRPVLADADPKHAVAAGAALAAERSATARAAAIPTAATPGGPEAAAPSVSRRRALVAGVGLAALAVALASLLPGRIGDRDGGTEATGPNSTATTTPAGTARPAGGPDPTAPPDPALEAGLLTRDDLPAGWEETEQPAGGGADAGPHLCGVGDEPEATSPDEALGGAVAAFERIEPLGWVGQGTFRFADEVAGGFVTEVVESARACEWWDEDAVGEGTGRVHITSVPEEISGPRLGDESAWVGSRSTWDWVDDPTMEPTNVEMISVVVRRGDTITMLTVLALDPITPPDRTLLQDLATAATSA